MTSLVRYDNPIGAARDDDTVHSQSLRQTEEDPLAVTGFVLREKINNPGITSPKEQLDWIEAGEGLSRLIFQVLNRLPFITLSATFSHGTILKTGHVQPFIESRGCKFPSVASSGFPRWDLGKL